LLLLLDLDFFFSLLPLLDLDFFFFFPLPLLDLHKAQIDNGGKYGGKYMGGNNYIFQRLLKIQLLEGASGFFKSRNQKKLFRRSAIFFSVSSPTPLIPGHKMRVYLPTAPVTLVIWVVTHPSTIRAQHCLTSVIKWALVSP
jgi:hypothetical protein